MSRYELFDHDRIKLRSLDARGHELVAADCLALTHPAEPLSEDEFERFVASILAARRKGPGLRRVPLAFRVFSGGRALL